MFLLGNDLKFHFEKHAAEAGGKGESKQREFTY